MLVPRQFVFENEWFSWMNGTSGTVLFGTRAALGILACFIAFQGVRSEVFIRSTTPALLSGMA